MQCHFKYSHGAAWLKVSPRWLQFAPKMRLQTNDVLVHVFFTSSKHRAFVFAVLDRSQLATCSQSRRSYFSWFCFLVAWLVALAISSVARACSTNLHSTLHVVYGTKTTQFQKRPAPRTNVSETFLVFLSLVHAIEFAFGQNCPIKIIKSSEQIALPLFSGVCWRCGGGDTAATLGARCGCEGGW